MGSHFHAVQWPTFTRISLVCYLVLKPFLTLNTFRKWLRMMSNLWSKITSPFSATVWNGTPMVNTYSPFPMTSHSCPGCNSFPVGRPFPHSKRFICLFFVTPIKISHPYRNYGSSYITSSDIPPFPSFSNWQPEDISLLKPMAFYNSSSLTHLCVKLAS